MSPFTLRFTLSRRQRLPEFLPWLPALAGSVGFSIGAAVLAADVSAWFLALLLLPAVLYRGLFAFLLDLAARPRTPVELAVDGTTVEAVTRSGRRRLPLDGIIQVFRSGGSWTVLHLDGSSLTIPADAVADDQLDFLKSFALRAAAARRAARAES